MKPETEQQPATTEASDIHKALQEIIGKKCLPCQMPRFVADAISAAQQPLIDALEKVTKVLDEYGESENPAIDSLNKIEAVVHAALAKVKVGK